MTQGAAWPPSYLALPSPSHQEEAAEEAHSASEASFPSIFSDFLAHHLAALHAAGTNGEQQDVTPLVNMTKSIFGAAAMRRSAAAVWWGGT